jgi:hypothetical protein
VLGRAEPRRGAGAGRARRRVWRQGIFALCTGVEHA